MRSMKNSMKKLVAGFAGLLLFTVCTVTVFAANATIVEKYTTAENIVMYVKGVDGTVSEASYQVGKTAGTVDSVSYVSETAEGMYTLILWDNSISVMKVIGTRTQNILTDVIANRCANEKFAIATIEKKATYLTDYTNDYATLKSVVTGVESENKAICLIDTLYEAIVALNNMDNYAYKRIIIISDGMDSTEVGYSKAELDALMAKTAYPIYTIGTLSKGGETELQNLFALSRNSNADYFYLDEITDDMSVVQALSKDYSMLQVKASVPAEIQDGSTQNSQLTLTSGSNSYVATAEVQLPFFSGTTEEEPDDTEVDADTPDEPEEDKDDKKKKDDKKDDEGLSKEMILIIAIGGVLFVLFVVIIILVATKGKKKPETGNDYAKLDQQLRNERNNILKNAPVPPMAPRGPMPPTPAPTTGNKTQMLFGAAPAANAPAPSAPVGNMGHRVTLVNVADPVKSYQCSLTDKIIIGRNPATANLAITTDGAVSEKHCEIGITGKQFYIKDLGSSNGTYVNNHKITAMTEVRSGCILKLGRGEYRLTVE